ncbi:MAG: serine hydrolase [Acidobacteria bacterium]|nr:serine hydrolase [Acidobacteriota bacterium]
MIRKWITVFVFFPVWAQVPTSVTWSTDKLEQAKHYWESMHESAVIVLDDGHQIVSWGPTEHKIKLSSVRKSLLSMMFGPHVTHGTIDLDATLAELGMDDMPPLSDQEKMATVRMLMQSRSGIYHDYVGGSPRMKESQPARHSHAPGTFWYYNNWDFNALGTIFEQQTGLSIGDGFDRVVAKPIGLKDFMPGDVYYVDSGESRHRQYHFRMNARDLAQVGLLMLRRGTWEGASVITPDWVDTITTSYSTTHHNTGYGFMWWIADKGVLFEDVKLPDGSYAAFGAMGKFLVVIPEYKLVIVHLQMVEWPDNYAHLPPSEVPNRATDENNRKIVGHLIQLLLNARET